MQLEECNINLMMNAFMLVAYCSQNNFKTCLRHQFECFKILLLIFSIFLELNLIFLEFRDTFTNFKYFILFYMSLCLKFFDSF
jgi:hypothetical protein